MRLRQQEPRVAFERAVAVPLLVLQILERRLRRSAGVVRTEGVERLARELQAVLDGLFRDVGLRKVVEEVGVDALEPAGVTALDQVGVFPVERPALATGQRAIEDVAHDPARESEPIATRFALFLEDSFMDEPIDRVLYFRGPFR